MAQSGFLRPIVQKLFALFLCVPLLLASSLSLGDAPQLQSAPTPTDYELVTPEAILSEVEKLSAEVAVLENHGHISESTALATYSALSVLAVSLINHGLAHYFYTVPAAKIKYSFIDNRISRGFIREGLFTLINYTVPAALSGSLISLFARQGRLPPMHSYEFPQIVGVQFVSAILATGLDVLQHSLRGKKGLPTTLHPKGGAMAAIGVGLATTATILSILRTQKHFTRLDLKVRLHSLKHQLAHARSQRKSRGNKKSRTEKSSALNVTARTQTESLPARLASS